MMTFSDPNKASVRVGESLRETMPSGSKKAADAALIAHPAAGFSSAGAAKLAGGEAMARKASDFVRICTDAVKAAKSGGEAKNQWFSRSRPELTAETLSDCVRLLL
jgi:hypothetical protein